MPRPFEFAHAGACAEAIVSSADLPPRGNRKRRSSTASGGVGPDRLPDWEYSEGGEVSKGCRHAQFSLKRLARRGESWQRIFNQTNTLGDSPCQIYRRFITPSWTGPYTTSVAIYSDRLW